LRRRLHIMQGNASRTPITSRTPLEVLVVPPRILGEALDFREGKSYPRRRRICERARTLLKILPWNLQESGRQNIVSPQEPTDDPMTSQPFPELGRPSDCNWELTSKFREDHRESLCEPQGTPNTHKTGSLRFPGTTGIRNCPPGAPAFSGTTRILGILRLPNVFRGHRSRQPGHRVDWGSWGTPEVFPRAGLSPGRPPDLSTRLSVSACCSSRRWDPYRQAGLSP
jgi:hypothetical protein